MKHKTIEKIHFAVCKECNGLGKKRLKPRKNERIRHKQELAKFANEEEKNLAPIAPLGSVTECGNCNGSGLRKYEKIPQIKKETYPHLAIIGGGIGGVAVAVACYHRGIPFTLYEKDTSFDARSQGYGLTLQQASKAMAGFGIDNLSDSLVSTKHIVHNTNGEIIGEWGMRKWMQTDSNSTSKKTNIHIARQALRQALMNQLSEENKIQWNHQLVSFNEKETYVELHFAVDGEIKKTQADIVIGADGIRSSVRKTLIGEEISPLRYLDCIVILGICKLADLKEIENPLLDSATVFQTVNGTERMYMMPYDSDSIMWQFSFPLPEKEAKELSSKGPEALKKETTNRTDWHSPIPEIIAATDESLISGYPVYDRELLKPELLKNSKKVTLIGDAAHPMSPFKGQGANQALLDALSLARGITKGCRPNSNWREHGIRETVLNKFEAEMLKRTASKVKDSAAAAKFLHTEEVMREANEPRRTHLKRKEE